MNPRARAKARAKVRLLVPPAGGSLPAAMGIYVRKPATAETARGPEEEHSKAMTRSLYNPLGWMVTAPGALAAALSSRGPRKLMPTPGRQSGH